MQVDEIHPQLMADCHLLGNLPATAVLLNRNAILPWFVLLPDTRLPDLLDLPEEHLQAVIRDCATVSAFVKEVMGFAKVNFGGLGNVVPQMHLHIIGRSDDDPCWPKPIWGNLKTEAAYRQRDLREYRDQLKKMAGLIPAPF